MNADEYLQAQQAEATGELFSMSMEQSLRNHYAENQGGTPPEGWWVHGRYGRDNLNTGHVILLTRSNQVAERYAGSNGSVWYVRPKHDAKVWDTGRDEDIESLRAFVREELQDYNSPIYDDFQNAHPDWDEDDISDEDIDDVVSEFMPRDIVNSAEAYDNHEWVLRLWDSQEVDFVVTPDGAVVINLEAIEAVRVDEQATGDLSFSIFNETLEYPGEALVSFSVSDTLMEDIRRAAYNKIDSREHIHLCTMPTVLRMMGEPDGDVYTLPGTISKLVYTHNLAHPEVYRAIVCFVILKREILKVTVPLPSES